MSEINLKLDFNERSDFPPAWVRDYRPSPSDLWRYPDRSSLEQTIADFYGLGAEQVLACNGGDESINLLFQLMEAQSFILPLPAFSQYLKGCETWRAKGILIPAKASLGIDLDAILRTLEEGTASWLVVTRPNNPTGETIAAAELEKLLDAAVASGCQVFLDEAYIEFTAEQASSLQWLERYSNLVILRTMSKAYGLAGIRVGYLLGNADLIQQFRAICMPFNVNVMSVDLATLAFTPEVQADTASYVEEVRNNREQLIDWLTAQQIETCESAANFVLIRLTPLRKRLVVEGLRRSGISVRDFPVSPGGELDNCLRITVPRDMTLLMESLTSLLKPELICLDMDGVLVDTSASYDECIKRTVAQFTGSKPTQQQIEALRSQGGYNNDWDLSGKLIELAGSEIVATREQVVETFQRFYLGTDQEVGMVEQEQVIVETPLVERLLRLDTEGKVRTAIVTGRPLAEAEAGASKVGLQQCLILSDDDVKNSKPAPDGICKAQQLCGAGASWMFGDTPDDMQAALAAGAIGIGVGSANAVALSKAGATIVIDTINELNELISWSD